MKCWKCELSYLAATTQKIYRHCNVTGEYWEYNKDTERTCDAPKDRLLHELTRQSERKHEIEEKLAAVNARIKCISEIMAERTSKEA